MNKKLEKNIVYKPKNYDRPIALNAIPSKECDEYHKNSFIQININEKHGKD